MKLMYVGEQLIELLKYKDEILEDLRRFGVNVIDKETGGYKSIRRVLDEVKERLDVIDKEVKRKAKMKELIDCLAKDYNIAEEVLAKYGISVYKEDGSYKTVKEIFEETAAIIEEEKLDKIIEACRRRNGNY